MVLLDVVREHSRDEQHALLLHRLRVGVRVTVEMKGTRFSCVGGAARA